LKKTLLAIILLSFLFSSIALAILPQGLVLVITEDVTENGANRQQIEDDIASQLQLLESKLDLRLPTLEVQVYPDYMAIGQKLWANDENIVRIVVDNSYFRELGRTKPIFDQILSTKWPGCSANTIKIVSTYLLYSYLGVSIADIASLSRYTFNNVPIPSNLDPSKIHQSLIDRACAKLFQIETFEGRLAIKAFLKRSLSIGMDKAIEEFYKGDFRAFVRGPVLPLPKEDGRDLLIRTSQMRERVWFDMPSKPIPWDYEVRYESEMALERSQILINKGQLSLALTILDDLEQQIKANGTKVLVWWIAGGGLALTFVISGFWYLLTLATAYGSYGKTGMIKQQLIEHQKTLEISRAKNVDKTEIVKNELPKHDHEKPKRTRGKRVPRVDQSPNTKKHRTKKANDGI